MIARKPDLGLSLPSSRACTFETRQNTIPQDCPYVQLLMKSKEKLLITSGEVFRAKFCQLVLPYKS